MLSTDPQRPLPRIVAGLAGLAMISLGVAPILKRGDIFYTNWFGELVFSPLAIIFGLFTIGAPCSSRLGFPPVAKWCVENDSWRNIAIALSCTVPGERRRVSQEADARH
jgi:hypothetical protein